MMTARGSDMMARSGSCRRLGAYNQMVNRLTVQSVDRLSLEKSSIRAFRFDAAIFLLLTFEYCADFLGFGNIIVDIALGIVHHLRTLLSKNFLRLLDDNCKSDLHPRGR